MLTASGSLQQAPQQTKAPQRPLRCLLTNIHALIANKINKLVAEWLQQRLASSNCKAAASQVASQYSEDAARKRGDLGWKRRNELVGPFADAAFQLQVC
eukprot:jgi/Chrzof1/331/Cz01g11200.t1